MYIIRTGIYVQQKYDAKYKKLTFLNSKMCKILLKNIKCYSKDYTEQWRLTCSKTNGLLLDLSIFLYTC